MNDIARMEARAMTLQNSFTAELFTSWISYIGDSSPRTIKTYTKNIYRLAEYLQLNGIAQPKRADIIAYRDFLKQNYKPSTVQGYMAAVKLFFKWTDNEGLYPNVADNVRTAKVEPGHKEDYLTTKQANKLLSSVERESIKGLRDYAILSLMTTTGLRTVSIINADIGDIRTAGDNVVLYYKGKGHEEKNVYVVLAEPVEEAIRAYLNARGKAADTEPLFSSTSNNNKGGRMTTRAIRDICGERLTEAGLKTNRITAHSLRHTAAMINLRNGATVEETQQLLDHSNINTTLIYVAALEREKNQSEKRIAKAIFG